MFSKCTFPLIRFRHETNPNFAADRAAAIYGGHIHQTFSTLIPASGRGQAPVLLGQVRNSGVEYTRSQICIKNNKIVGSSLQHVLKSAAPTINTGVVSTITTQDATAAALVKKYKDQLTGKLDVKIGSVSGVFPRGGTPAVERSGENPMGDYIADLLRAKYKTDFAITTLDFIIYGGDGYLNVFSPAKAKVKGALLDVFVEALKADMAAGKVTQVPALDGRVKKVG